MMWGGGKLEDIWHHPSDYLNGTAPANVTSYVTAACGSACAANNNNASSPSDVDDGVRDSYMWYDSLHPSEQTDRIIAREFVDIVTGKGRWGRTWTSRSSCRHPRGWWC